MTRYLKILFFLFVLSLSNNVNAKPVPPGAGGGDVAANILFLVDSSASMGRWIGGDGIGPVGGVTYDSSDRILFTQYSRRTAGAVIRYTAAGSRDRTFRPIRSVPNAGCTQFNDMRAHTFRQNLRLRKAHHIEFVESLDSVSFDESVIFFHSGENRTRSYIYGFSEDGARCLVALRAPRSMNYRGFDIQEIGGVPYLFAAGGGRRSFGFFMSCNLETFVCNEQEFRAARNVVRWFGRMSVNNDGSMVYFSNLLENNLEGYTLTRNGNAFTLGDRSRQCNATNAPTLTSELAIPFSVEVSPTDSSIVYTTSVFSHAIQKIQVSDSTTNSCTIVTSVGSGSRTNLSNSGTANELDADNVGFNQPHALDIDIDAANNRFRILTGTARGYVDEFDEDKFTAVARNTTWRQQMGGPRIRRWDGVKSAINAIVNDTTLTTGAYFGFGHWNAGEHGRSRGAPRGGRYCHRANDCNYYQGWTGDHPDGRSTQCNRDSCLNVAISPKGSDLIMDVMRPLGMAWGTDAHAFSQIAEDYFLDQNAGGSLLNPDADCQINYVIVIGDGAMNQTGLPGDVGDTASRMARLREMGVKSLYVAYGGGIRGTALNRFHELSRIGTSELPAGTTAQECIDDEDCERAIIANTPERLKTALTAKIRQIIADKLAFTAPSITATIEEGGSLYQAQFGYEQFGEWQGRILRKKLLKPADCPADNEDCVEHNTLPGNPHGNWDASRMIKRQSTPGAADDGRNIWSAMPGASYLGNWDNFNQDQSTAVTNLFNILGYEVDDYHNSTSNCTAVGNDTVLGNETIGLINFMKGNDYFDYDGDCDVTEVRDHVMGDIYHSQLVEVGAPDANLDFTSFNEEAYHRSTRGYARFKVEQANRLNVIYAGSNAGILHAIAAKSGNGYNGGEEIWGFVPPFVAAKLPQIINPEYDKSSGGGTNPIFGVDGSPVIHDAFIRGYNFRGELEGSRSWRTLLFVPYGRGGAGFSLLDITDPIPSGNRGPIHMVSVFNDRINNRVLVADVLGRISSIEYNATSASLMNSAEGEVAQDNFNDARDDEEAGNTVTVNGVETPPTDAIAACSEASDFRNTGTASCYRGNTFYFPDLVLDYPIGEEIPKTVLGAVKLNDGVPTPISLSSAQMSDDGSGGAILKVVFKSSQVFNANPSEAEPTLSDEISVRACIGGSGIDPAYDYSQMGETWSTPKIVRIPSSSGSSNIGTDRYVAIMGAGMSKGDSCAGSALFVIDLEGHMDGMPGRIYGSEINGGPINLIDTTPNGILSGDVVVETTNGSNIPNAVPAAPVVITPDSAPGVPWRGALVYVNDLEGKITKINLTSNTKGLNEQGNLVSGVTELYDQTTLFRLGATRENARYSYFSMEAGLGVTDKSFWLFGSTGNFTDLGGKGSQLDNILYGVQDKHYPYWKHLNGVKVPKIVLNPGIDPMEINPDFIKLAHEGADKASSVTNAFNCVNVSGDQDGDNCPIPETADAWVIHLEKNQNNAFLSPRTFRKASAPPTLFKGIVYYPVYQPPPGSAPCAQGHAFICAADDECGTNSSDKLKLTTPGDVNNPGLNACAYVSEGVLSELVVFGDKLFANVAGPSEDKGTLFSVFSVPGETLSNRGGWRDSGF